MNSLLQLIAAVLVLCYGTQATTIGSASYKTYCLSFLQGGRLPKTCLELRCKGNTKSGVYTVYPTESSDYSVDVYCDQKTDGGGWTVFQRRMDGSVDFYRNWQNYKLGFGDVNAEHWLGNDKLHELASAHANNELRFDLEAVDNIKVYATYSTFRLADESAQYRLTATGYAGTAGDAIESYRHPANGMKFSTYDYDYDTYGTSCAERFKGAWWYQACHGSNLNGRYLNGAHDTFADGVNWQPFKGYKESLKTTEMKFRGQV